MTLRDFEKEVRDLVGAPVRDHQVRRALNEALRELDNQRSLAAGPAGREYATIDLTKGRDFYPAPKFVRIASVERFDTAGQPYALSPVTPGQFTEVSRRQPLGHFWAPVQGGVLISPKPTEDLSNGLRVWGYMRSDVEDWGPERLLPVEGTEETYVLYRVALKFVSNRGSREVLAAELRAASEVLTQQYEQPFAGVSGEHILTEG